MQKWTRIVIFAGIFLLFVIAVSWAKQYEYDALNRLARITYDNSMQITYTYDKVGNRTQRISTLQADTSIDGTVDFLDYSIMASRWLDEGCSYTNEWCEGGDINWSTEVNLNDLATLAENWLHSAW